MSYLSNHPDGAAWSKTFNNYDRWIFELKPTAQCDREWPSVGLLIMILGRVLSPPLRCLLSRKLLLFSGKVSFSICLLHAIFMCSIMPWILYVGAPPLKVQVSAIEEHVAIFITLGCMFVTATTGLRSWSQSLERLLNLSRTSRLAKCKEHRWMEVYHRLCLLRASAS